MTTLSTTELITSLLTLNNPESPFIISQIDNTTVEATWNLIDAKWLDFFGKRGMTETFKIQIHLDDNTHVGRFTMIHGTIRWLAGVPNISYSLNNFKGQKIGFEVKKGWGIKDNFQPGKLYDVNINFSTIHTPILAEFEKAGWKLERDFLNQNTKWALIIGVGTLILLVVGLTWALLSGNLHATTY